MKLFWMICLITLNIYAIDGNKILQESDAKLIPAICSYNLTLVTSGAEGIEGTQIFNGFKKGDKKNVLIVKEPKKISGSVHLRKDEVIWSYYTTNRKLTKMAYQSIFMGTLLNYGDILATELSADYEVADLKSTTNEHILTLTPKKGKEAYAKIILKIDKKSLLPQNRQYFALSGLLLKECSFKKIDYDTQNNLKYLEMEFNEPLKNKKTTVKFENIVIKTNLSDKYYNENFIEHLGD